MAIAILFVCFISIFLCLAVAIKTTSKTVLFIGSALVFSAVMVLLTEVLSALHQLNYRFMLTGWSLITLLFIACLYFNAEPARQFAADLNKRVRTAYSGLTKTDRFLLLSALLIILLIFIAAILYPPNNWDAMTYHMARITSWVSHQSLAHYPTAITRQLYQPPFAEYVIMNFGILSHSDLFSNCVQFVFFLFSLVALVSITAAFGLNRQYKVIAVVLGVTIPEVVLQAASTQNDVVASFFIITTFLFVVKIIKNPDLKNFTGTGLAAGLALFTKGTAYLYLAPILLLLGVIVFIRFFKHKQYSAPAYSFVALFIALTINAGHYSRNYQLTHNVLGVDKAESNLYSNQKMNAGLLVSNIIKNAGLHAGIMFVKPAAVCANKAIYKLHDLAGINVNDTATNYRNIRYSAITLTTDEEGSPNPFHFLLITFSLLLAGYRFMKGRRNLLVTALSLIIICQVILFCAYLKWQPWHSRLHIPLFLISAPLICCCMSCASWFKKAFYWLSPVLIVYAIIVVLHCDRRPFSKIIAEDRYQKYFAGNPPIFNDYKSINDIIQNSEHKNIGLILGIDDWEYPFFTRCFERELNPVYIKADNFSKAAIEPVTKIDCIISTTNNTPFIDFNGRRFINKTTGNSVAWLYE